MTAQANVSTGSAYARASCSNLAPCDKNAVAGSHLRLTEKISTSAVATRNSGADIIAQRRPLQYAIDVDPAFIAATRPSVIAEGTATTATLSRKKRRFGIRSNRTDRDAAAGRKAHSPPRRSRPPHFSARLQVDRVATPAELRQSPPASRLRLEYCLRYVAGQNFGSDKDNY